MTWNDLVKIYGSEDDSIERICIFILPPETELILYGTLIRWDLEFFFLNINLLTLLSVSKPL